MFGLKEAHRQQDKVGLNDFWLVLFHHQRPSAFWVGLPFYLLHLDTCHLSILSEELEGVDVPTTDAAFFVAAGRLEDDRPVGPRRTA